MVHLCALLCPSGESRSGRVLRLRTSVTGASRRFPGATSPRLARDRLPPEMEKPRPERRIFAESAGSGAGAGTGPKKVTVLQRFGKIVIRHTEIAPADRIFASMTPPGRNAAWTHSDAAFAEWQILGKDCERFLWTVPRMWPPWAGGSWLTAPTAPDHIQRQFFQISPLP